MVATTRSHSREQTVQESGEANPEDASRKQPANANKSQRPANQKGSNEVNIPDKKKAKTQSAATNNATEPTSDSNADNPNATTNSSSTVQAPLVSTVGTCDSNTEENSALTGSKSIEMSSPSPARASTATSTNPFAKSVLPQSIIFQPSPPAPRKKLLLSSQHKQTENARTALNEGETNQQKYKHRDPLLGQKKAT